MTINRPGREQKVIGVDAEYPTALAVRYLELTGGDLSWLTASPVFAHVFKANPLPTKAL